MSPTDAERLRRREISQAVADATCDRAVGRARVARWLISSQTRRVVRDRAFEISTYRTLIRRALTRIAQPGSGLTGTG